MWINMWPHQACDWHFHIFHRVSVPPDTPLVPMSHERTLGHQVLSLLRERRIHLTAQWSLLIVEAKASAVTDFPVPGGPIIHPWVYGFMKIFPPLRKACPENGHHLWPGLCPTLRAHHPGKRTPFWLFWYPGCSQRKARADEWAGICLSNHAHKVVHNLSWVNVDTKGTSVPKNPTKEFYIVGWHGRYGRCLQWGTECWQGWWRLGCQSAKLRKSMMTFAKIVSCQDASDKTLTPCWVLAWDYHKFHSISIIITPICIVSCTSTS